jgi:hypothetical protein
MPFFPDSSSYPKKLSSEYQLYACGNFFGHSSILEKIAILGQPPRRPQNCLCQIKGDSEGAGCFLKAISQKKFHWVSPRSNIWGLPL